MKQDSNRINWIDMAKGYGIIAVFIGHMVQNSPLGLFVYSFHLPLFFFISGYLFKEGDGLGVFLKKKCRSILLPYFTLGLLVVFCDAFYPLFFSGRHFSTRHLLLELYKGFKTFLIQERYSTLWYLAVLFGVNILMYLVCRIKNQALQAIVVAALFVGAMIYYRLGGGELPWDVDAAFPALLFFWAGYYVKGKDLVREQFMEAERRPLLLVIFFVLNIAFNILTLFISGEGLEMYRCCYGVPPLTVISAFAGIFFIIMLSVLTTLKPILYIGKNSLIFFMWHQAVVYPVLDAVFYALGIDGYGRNPAEFMAIVFARLIITCLIMWGMTEILQRTPLRIFTGK